MTRSLGMTLYSLFAGRGVASPAGWPDRPQGRLVWLHAPGPGPIRGLRELARRLREEDDLTVLLTSQRSETSQAGLISIAPPPENDAMARAFLDHWRPDVAIFSDGELRPLLLAQAAARDLPMILAEARTPYLPGSQGRLWPGLMTELLSRFRSILALDDAAARRFRRRGAPAGIVRIEGRLAEGSRVLPCTEAERAALVRLFQTRPVWLAAGLPEEEEAAVIAAHRSSLRMAHRLLLILVPDQPERGDLLAQSLETTEGWRVARRSFDEEPDEETEVFIADAPSEMGLWYRLAPITFLGGSLFGRGSLRDPYEAAALGSAILHGPRSGEWAMAFARLIEAHATRPVSSPGDLAEGLADLLSPDRAARLAQGAWATATAGAEVTDRLILQVRALLGDRA